MQVDVKVCHVLVCRHAFEWFKWAFRKRSENIVFFRRHIDVDFIRETAQTFLSSNDC